jgi:mRNA interferase MazF
VKSRDIHWARLPPPIGDRPVCILTRDRAIEALERVTVAPITRTIRGIRSEVAVGADEGLPAESVITCDNLLTVPKSALDPEALGSLSPATTVALDRALRYALGIRV